MTEQTPPPASLPPSKRDRLRPLELLVMALIVAVFVGLVVTGAARNIQLGAIFAGVAFIVSVVVLATLAITSRPDEDERRDLDDQDRAGH